MLTSPPDELRLTTTYANFYAALGAATLMLGIAVVAVLLAGGGLTELLWLFVFLGTFWLGLVALTGWNTRRLVERERRDALALFTAPPWAEWCWSASEWARELEERRAALEKHLRWQRRVPWFSLVPAAIIGGCALLPVLLAGDAMPLFARQFISGLAVFFALLAVWLSISGARRASAQQQQRFERAQQTAAPWLRFGPYGFYHETDGHTPLRQLAGVRYARTRQRLHFQLRHLGPRGSSLAQTISVPVPVAASASAEALAKRYRSEHGLSAHEAAE